MDKAVSKKLTVMSFVMAIVILVYHIKPYFMSIDNSSKVFIAIKNLFGYAGSIAMGYFFITSGFLLYRKTKSKEKSHVKLKKRIKTLVIPFLLWNIIYLFLVNINFYNINFPTIKEIIIGFTLSPFVGDLWYIFELIILLIPFLFLYNKDKSILFIIVITFIISLFMIYPDALKNSHWFGSIERIIRYLSCYFIGAYIGITKPELWLKKEYDKKSKVISLIILIISLGYMAIYGYQIEPNGINLSRFIYLFLIIFLPISIWILIDAKRFKSDIKYPFKISFFIYVLHQSFVLPYINNYFISKMILKYQYNTLVLFGTWALSTVICYLIILILVILLKKILAKKFFENLSGGRID